MASSRKKNAQPLPNRTDAGNAELIAWLYRDDLRFDHARKRWLHWSGKRWIEDTQEQVLVMAKRAARHRMALVAKRFRKKQDDDQYKVEVGWCFQSEHKYRIRAALDLAKAEQPISSSGEEFDRNSWLLGVENGIVDLRSGEFREARREDGVTLSTNIAYDGTACCPLFERFLSEVFEQDEELIGFIWRAIGYTLTGNVGEQCLFACHGLGANGKSTLLGVLHHVMGDYAFNLPFSAFEIKQRGSIPNDIVRLESRRFVTAIETGEGVRLNEERIKTLTGGDLITARLLHKEFVTFDPTHKLWVAFNHKPIITDDTPAMWRRVKMIPFNRRFTEDEQDKNLMEKLKAEAPGILSKAVRACLEWQQGGLGAPRAVTVATQEYQEESDQMTAFLGEVCTVEEGLVAPCADLFKRYLEWAAQNGETPLKRKQFTQRLEAKGLRKGRHGHENVWSWEGVGLPGVRVEA